MNVETIAIADLAFDPANARRHSVKNLDAIKGSLAKFGQQKPIVVDGKGVVVAGNGTLEAARSLGWPKIAVVRTELTGADAIAFALADNRTAELAEWDAGILNETLKSLQAMDFDLGSIGFDADDLAALIATPEPPEGLTDPDAVPENVETRCKPGDLWLLGGHRLICGDSTDVLQVARLMGGSKADMVFTDPPYGMHLDTDYTKMAEIKVKSKTYRPVEGDDRDFDPAPIIAMFDEVKEQFWWGGDWYHTRLPPGGSWIVWDKRSEASDGLTGNHFEMLWSRHHHRRFIIRHLWSGFTARNADTKRVHPTEKPVTVLERVITEYSDKDAKIIDLFLGSGSTLIACHKTQRRCFGMEIDPKYCDVILSRWEQFTGKGAQLVVE